MIKNREYRPPISGSEQAPLSQFGSLSTPDTRGVIQNTHEKHRITPDKLGEFTKESVNTYLAIRQSENYNLIRRKDPFLAHVYQTLMQEHPVLRCVKVIDENTNGAFYSRISKLNNHFFQTIHFNFSNSETYLRPNTNKNDSLGLDYALKTIALKTGAKYSEISTNKHLITSFIMMHEFGHAYDFLRNYLSVEAHKQNENHSSTPDTIAQALPRAYNNDYENRLKDLMTLPIPGQTTSDNTSEKIQFFANRLRALGIDPNNRSDVILHHKKSYRETSSESFADNFAATYIINHYSDFFSTANSPSSSEKARTHLGEWRLINDDLDMLGLAEGKSISLTKYDQKDGIPFLRNKPEKEEGFLLSKLKIGEEIVLLDEGNPDPTTSRKQLPRVKNVFILPTKKNNQIVNKIIIQLNDNASRNNSQYYLVELTNKEPPEIIVDSKEITSNLNLTVGSKVLLMKRELNTNSIFKLGDIIGGRLEPADETHDRPIMINAPIILSSTVGEYTGIGNLVDPDFMTGGNTSPIIKIYRKWKRYYLRTHSSIYEVIPYV